MASATRLCALALACAALFLMSGCIQPSLPSQCTAVPAGKLANCIYTAAVSEQNPFYCYSIPDMEKRATCMRHSQDPSMKKALSRAEPEVREQIFANNSAVQPPAEPSAPPSPTAECDSLEASYRQACISSKAMREGKVELCELLFDTSLRTSCIGSVAQKTKDIKSCDSLSDDSDVSLCKSYAKG